MEIAAQSAETEAIERAGRSVMGAFSNKNLIWIDMEMTGLDPERDRILELAAVITDSDLNVVAEGPVIVVHQSLEVLEAMGSWCKEHHGKSGLTERSLQSTVTEAKAERQMLAFLKGYVPAGASPICGNSIGQDRRFLYKYMPELQAYFHYRYLDVSTIKILAQRWAPAIMEGLVKKESHRALDDILESIDELKYYRKVGFLGIQ